MSTCVDMSDVRESALAATAANWAPFEAGGLVLASTQAYIAALSAGPDGDADAVLAEILALAEGDPGDPRGQYRREWLDLLLDEVVLAVFG